MRAWWKQFIPYLLVLSLAGNLYLGVQIYNRQHDLNLYTWGNAVNAIVKSVVTADMEITQPKVGPMVDPPSIGIQMTMESVEALRSLPDFDKRVSEDDMQTIKQFLRYAETAYGIAVTEQAQSGSVSAESRERLTKIHEGLRVFLRVQQETNQPQVSKNPWNHADWRVVFHKLAVGLGELKFVPLPD